MSDELDHTHTSNTHTSASRDSSLSPNKLTPQPRQHLASRELDRFRRPADTRAASGRGEEENELDHDSRVDAQGSSRAQAAAEAAAAAGGGEREAFAARQQRSQAHHDATQHAAHAHAHAPLAAISSMRTSRQGTCCLALLATRVAHGAYAALVNASRMWELLLSAVSAPAREADRVCLPPSSAVSAVCCLLLALCLSPV